MVQCGEGVGDALGEGSDVSGKCSGWGGWERMWSRGMCCGHCVSLKKYVAIVWLMETYRASGTQRDGKRDWEMECVAASQAFVRSRG